MDNAVSPRYYQPREFLALELQRVVAHFTIIYETRDRFFNNFMSVSIALYGFLGLIFKDMTAAKAPDSGEDMKPFAVFMLLTLALFGLGTLFLNTANWLARDFYRQRRKCIHDLLTEPDDAKVQAGLAKYLDFSRDQTRWHYRPTSIYFIYNTAIALSNGIAIAFALRIGLVHQLTLPKMALIATTLLVLQHAVTMVYLWVYRWKTYREG
jgi:hypothetical protein